MSELKPGWTRVKFGEIAECVNDRVDDPSAAGVERYVGLEHLDPDDLRIRRWGIPDDVESTKLRFRSGDIIFGKRRAYQRKLAVADFEGICSAHAMVLRAKSGAVVPEFLPFFMQSDVFMDRAVTISVGSLSPTISWKALAAVEFALPPLQEQARLAEVASAALAHVNAASGWRAAAERLLEAELVATFSSIDCAGALQEVSLPIVRGIDSPGPNIPGGVPYVRIAEMTGPDGIIADRLLRTSSEIADAHPESRLVEGDMVVALRGVVGLPVWVPPSAAGANLSRGTARLSIRPEHNPIFFYWALRGPIVQREVLRMCTGWKGEDLREITLGSLRSLQVPVPSRIVQNAVAERLESVAASVNAISSRADHSRRLIRSIFDAGNAGNG